VQRNRSAGGAKLYVISVFKVQLVSYDKNQYITEWDLLARVKFHNLEINQNRKKTVKIEWFYSLENIHYFCSNIINYGINQISHIYNLSYEIFWNFQNCDSEDASHLTFVCLKYEIKSQ
jgi:hypothetical protein